MTSEAKYDMDDLKSRYPNLSRETIQGIIRASRGNGHFLLESYNPHWRKIEMADADYDDVFDRFSLQPKKSTVEEIEEMITHNRQLLGLLTDIFDWDTKDPFRPDPEAIRRGY